MSWTGAAGVRRARSAATDTAASSRRRATLVRDDRDRSVDELLRHGPEAVPLVQPPRRRVGLARGDDPALRVRLELLERVDERARDPATEAVGVYDEAVDVDEHAGALPRDRADEALALVGPEEVLARLAQPPRRLLQRGQRARAEQVRFDPVGGALERDDGLGDAGRAEVELLDLDGHSPSAERIAAVGSPSARSPSPHTASARSRAPRRMPAAFARSAARRSSSIASPETSRRLAARMVGSSSLPMCSAWAARSAVPAAPRVSSSS